MKLRMHENSLFAILLRSPWWVSGAIATAVVVVARVWLPAAYVIYGSFVALPFVVLALAAAWKQARRPSATRVEKTLEALRAMTSGDFSAAVEDAFRSEGYVVTRFAGSGADFELSKAGRIALVAVKRWKAARTGIEPLRELHAAGQQRAAQECIYVAAGEFSDNARAYAAENNIRLVQDAELATLLPQPRPAK